MTIELKIKAKSLAAESKIIRQEEIKLRNRARYHAKRQNLIGTAVAQKARESLYLHRIDDVRIESRATHLTRAYIKGHPYNAVEAAAPQERMRTKLIKRIDSMVRKYSDRTNTKEDVVAWFDA